MKKLTILALLLIGSMSFCPPQVYISNSELSNEEISSFIPEGKFVFREALGYSSRETGNNAKVAYIEPNGNIHFLNEKEEQKAITQADQEKMNIKTGLKLIGQTEYKISKTKKEITFLSEDDKAANFTINLQDQQIKLQDTELKFDKKIAVSNKQNVFKSPWKGYRWKAPDKKGFQLIIGKLQNSEKLFLQIKTSGHSPKFYLQ